ncbi:hypothetical protein [Microbacterium marinilacus]|uniref:Lysophospholipase n=1 Tax=Microbacterium marinilacus TaxID=415209 RepID=A0ABP7BCL2_9MICO|nr:hypothetical protein [Microbacterium marinilacus]MBY0690226.1 hypothetical protein [Microbacterium marinilacus]
MTAVDTVVAGSDVAAATRTHERTAPAGRARGTVLVLPGRGDAPSYYRRLARRLASDGYLVETALAPVVDVDDVVAAWEPAAEGMRVVIGVDTSAGLLAAALAGGRLDPAPAGAVFAGIAVAGGETPDDELAARSACPLHGRVVADAGAPSLAASDIPPTWPSGAAGLPVLALHGEADRIAPPARAAALLDGWDAELVTVAGGLHDVLNDVHHRSVAAEIVAFLERLRADPTAAPILHRRARR